MKIKSTINGKAIQLHDYSNPESNAHDSFMDEAKLFASEFETALSDVDTCIMHDILYQGFHYVHNIGVRMASKNLPNVRFLSFAHSLPDKRPLNVSEDMIGRYTPMDNSYFIYPSHSAITALSEQYQVPEAYCRTVYNCAPIMTYNGLRKKDK